MSLLEGSAELRFPLFGDFGAVVFIDAGNVFASSFTYRLDDLRYAVGPGLRYKTPVGPIRLDVGFIVTMAQATILAVWSLVLARLFNRELTQAR